MGDTADPVFCQTRVPGETTVWCCPRYAQPLWYLLLMLMAIQQLSLHVGLVLCLDVFHSGDFMREHLDNHC
jgi:hypothetical protein